MNIRKQLLSAIPKNDYTVLNSSKFMDIINKIGMDHFHNELRELEKEKLIRYEMAYDGLMIFKN